MDQPEPPKIVLEQPAPCADGRAAQDVLTRTLAPSMAPGAAWTVMARVRRDHGALVAEGEITDSVGAAVAHRAIRKETNECGGLVRAVGVWASLVLDEEVRRAQTPPPAPPPDTEVKAAWPAPEPPVVAAPEQALFLKNPKERRSFEVGMGTSYQYGLLGDGGAAIGGAHVFTVFEVAGGWFLRPTIAAGRSLREVASATDLNATWGAARFDACRRMPGNYIERRGIQMDVCGGVETGLLAFDSGGNGRSPAAGEIHKDVTPLLAPGASLAMRGELASELSAEVRGLVGVNLLRDTILETNDGVKLQTLLVYARLELGLSWRVR